MRACSYVLRSLLLAVQICPEILLARGSRLGAISFPRSILRCCLGYPPRHNQKPFVHRFCLSVRPRIWFNSVLDIDAYKDCRRSSILSGTQAVSLCGTLSVAKLDNGSSPALLSIETHGKRIIFQCKLGLELCIINLELCYPALIHESNCYQNLISLSC